MILLFVYNGENSYIKLFISDELYMEQISAKVKAVIFDLDGVLVDACNWHYESLNESLQEISDTYISLYEHDMVFNALPTTRKLEILSAQNRIKHSQISEIYHLKQIKTNEKIDRFCSVDKSKIDLLKYIRSKGLKTSCVTNCSKQTAYKMLRKSEVFDFLDIIITNEDVQNVKPDPEPYNLAFSLLGITSQESVIVEDSFKGMQSALLSGCKNIIKVNNATEVKVSLLENLL